MRGIDSPDIRAEIMRLFEAGARQVDDGQIVEVFGDRLWDILRTFGAMVEEGTLIRHPLPKGISGYVSYTLAEDGARGEG
jgi:hypothetical protein